MSNISTPDTRTVEFILSTFLSGASPSSQQHAVHSTANTRVVYFENRAAGAQGRFPAICYGS